MRHTISVLVENEFGVLARIAGLFSGRGFNIESLSVAETLDPAVSRMTLVTHGDDGVIAQVEKQLNKLVNVIRVSDAAEAPHVQRELVLIKVAVSAATRAEVANLVDIFRGKIIDVSASTYVLEATGPEDKITALIALLEPIGILEVARTGRVAMYRGDRVLGLDDANDEDDVA
jgi:acetolactate synthase-1/3 small subunit